MRGRVAAGAAAAAVLLASVAALAHHGEIGDARDTKGVLDLRSATFHHRPPGEWVVRTHAPWRVRDVFDRGYVVVELDTLGSARADYFVLVRSIGNRLGASLWRDRRDRPDRRLAGLKVSRPNRYSLKVKVPFWLLRMGGPTFRWQVVTLLTGPSCRRVCIDRLPDVAPVVEPAPGAEPTPQPSITLTPTPIPTEPEPSPSPTPSAQ